MTHSDKMGKIYDVILKKSGVRFRDDEKMSQLGTNPKDNDVHRKYGLPAGKREERQNDDAIVTQNSRK